MIQFEVETRTHAELIDITDQIRRIVTEQQVQRGICTIFVPHTTAALTINENADPTVQRDLLYKLNDLIPWEDGYRHLEGNSAAHLKASLFGNSEQILIDNGQLVLGTWRGIYFAEFDGPRCRKVMVKVIEG